jgi:hypothetical protein
MLSLVAGPSAAVALAEHNVHQLELAVKELDTLQASMLDPLFEAIEAQLAATLVKMHQVQGPWRWDRGEQNKGRRRRRRNEKKHKNASC